MDNKVFDLKNRETRQQESHVLDNNGDIAVRTVLVSGGDSIDPVEINIGQVGGEDVPVLGTTPSIPTSIVDGNGVQVTSFGSINLNGNYRSPSDFTAAFKTSNTLDLTAFNNLVISDSSQIEGVLVVHADNTSELFKNGQSGITFTYAAGVLTIIGATPFVTGDIYEVHVNYQDKAYDPSSGTSLVYVTNPEWAHHAEVEHIVEGTTLTAGTYEEVINMDGYRSAAIQILAIGDMTAKVFMTLVDAAPDDDFTDPTWEDATLDILGVVSVSNSTGLGFIETLRMPKKIGFQYVTGGAANTIDILTRKY